MSTVAHLSYSGLKDFTECPYRFKLKYVDKIPSFSNSIHTIFGTIIHQCIQDFLLKKKDKSTTRKYFWRWWRTFYRCYKKHLDPKLVATLLRAGLNILNHIDTAFEGFETLSVEERLELPISDERPEINFKGFIDLVAFKDNQLVIADLKTAGSTYMFEKYLDEVKKFQLVYYKTYYAKKYSIALEDISVAFITLEKQPTSKEPIKFLWHPTSKREITKSQKLINEALHVIDNDDFKKNTSVCHNPKTGISCPFHLTEHCKV